MDETKVVVLQRHAESFSNFARSNGFVLPQFKSKLKKHTEDDVPLTGKGREQAMRAGLRLVGITTFQPTFDIAIHTGCARTEETLMLAISKTREHGYELVKTDFIDAIHRLPLLKERVRGFGFHLTRAEYLAKYAKEDEEYRKDKFNAIPPGGESRASIIKKWNLFKKMLFEPPFDYARTFLAVTHAGPMMVAEKDALGIANNRARYLQKPQNCEAYMLDIKYNNGYPKIARFDKLGVLK